MGTYDHGSCHNGARLEVMVHEQYGRLNEEAVEMVKQLAHRETALRLGLGAGEREANPLYGGCLVRCWPTRRVGQAELGGGDPWLQRCHLVC